MRTDPLPRFLEWLADARERGLPEPSAMALATVDANGLPAVRMVLLKHADDRGFVFYTNLASPKAEALRANARAELCFYWNPPGRQVRVHGAVSPVSDTEADAYFGSRPYLSRVGAWASEQSRPVPHALALPGRVAKLSLQFAGGPVPRPPHWGGFRLRAETVEFWEEKPYRLHERVRHRRSADAWEITALYP